MGQNFLVDDGIIHRIVDSAGDLSEKLVLEIGPGRGALTDLLVERSGQYRAIELDTILAEKLKSRFEGIEKVEIFEADVLEADLEKILAPSEGIEGAVIVANLPYNISSAVIERLAEVSEMFAEAILMLQSEVVDRLAAPPGNSSRGFLTVLTEYVFEAKRLFSVTPNCFRPRPKVQSAVASLRPIGRSRDDDFPRLRNLVSVAFRQKRKTILNNLKGFSGVHDPVPLLEAAGIDTKLRPEALTIEEWIKLAKVIGADSSAGE
ncbi:MAG: 16S rRNA (adenine(1518)-N(6)/adenine(1519)-N(6))-dimethyltransferase RsmA [Pyrinomonadaceae bacterium]